ncbi:MAG: hypothetical protein LZF86_240072 [Nitrospira sp.]|nr:MAG: hypothetical protein LZF86_240072 [Nitrospira sp.]
MSQLLISIFYLDSDSYATRTYHHKANRQFIIIPLQPDQLQFVAMPSSHVQPRIPHRCGHFSNIAHRYRGTLVGITLSNSAPVIF